MLNFAKKILPDRVKQQIKGLLGRPLTQLHQDWSILSPIGPVLTSHTALDVGAYRGWFFHCWRNWCPEATVHAFEPAPDAHARLAQRYTNAQSIILSNVAVGSQSGEMTLNIMEQSNPSNSLLRHRQSAWDAVQYQTGTISTVSVPVITLNDYCTQQGISSIYILKIDVQGYELEVLRGAENILKSVDHILVESGIVPLYENAPRFTAVADFLMDRGFHLMDMRAWHRGNHVLIETDMLFRADRLIPDYIDNSAHRFYKSTS